MMYPLVFKSVFSIAATFKVWRIFRGNQENICGEFNRSGSNKSTKLDGKLEANVDGIIKKIIGGVEGNANADAIKEEYNNVLREDMFNDILDTRSCRQKMAEVAIDVCNNKNKLDAGKIPPPQKETLLNNTRGIASNFSLTVRSNVYGDSVYVNGERVGSTKLHLTLPRGRHTIRVEKSGYIPYSETLELKENTTLWAKLKRIRKRVNSSSTLKKQPRLYSATSFCTRTNVQGISYNHYSYEDAIKYAIHDCVQRGGVESCCSQNTKIVNNNNINTQYFAESYCSITGVAGSSYGYTQQGAINSAIQDCINKGGDTDCCRGHAHLSNPLEPAHNVY